MRSNLLAKRSGVSLVEMAITIAIITILAAIGAGLILDTLPTWRTRGAAYEYAATIDRARSLALMDSRQYRVVVTRHDAILGDGEGEGAYLLQRGNGASASTEWDTLPVDSDPAVPPESGEGTTDFSKGAKDWLPGVGILEPGTNPPASSSGPISAALTTDPEGDSDVDADGDSDADSDSDSDSSTSTAGVISWGPSGVSTNPATDFNCDLNGDGVADGVICTVFFNDRAWQQGIYEYFTVVVSRAGMVRVVPGESATLEFGAGTRGTSFMGDGSGSGYSPGGSGGGGDTGGGGGPEVPELPEEPVAM